jgi:F1F0 ATPase subunit 2
VSELALQLLPAVLAGSGLAGLYLAALWWSLRRLPSVERPGSWMLASSIVRIAGLLAGLWLAGRGQPLPLVAAFLGFLATRTGVIAFVRSRWRREVTGDPTP